MMRVGPLVAWLLTFSGLLSGGPTRAEPPAAPPRLRMFSLKDIDLADPRLKAARQANRAYLLSLDPDRLLHVFRVNAGLPSQAEPLGGWEHPACELRGHFVGHYLSACAWLYEATGDEDIRRRADGLVAELARCQQALGGGYLSAFPESYLDRLEAGEPVWAPYYTLHKILAGLYDMHAHAANAQALEMALRLSGYIAGRCRRFSAAELRERLDRNEEGGICEALWNLHALAGSSEAREAADRLERRSFLDPLARGEDNLAGRHGNTHIPLAVGAVRRFEITGESRYLYAARFFWNRVVETRSYATGGSTHGEFWGEPFRLADTLSNTNHETCKTHNMLRLTRQLFTHTGDARYADFQERAFLNGILGTQAPDGMLEYYVPMAPGHRRVYGTPTDAFWCCYGTGIETFSRLGEGVWFHDDENLYAALYVASTVRWADKGVAVEQVTTYPDGEEIAFRIHAERPTPFTLQLRIPAWLRRPATLTLDGHLLDVPLIPGRFAAVRREWRGGERLILTLPMDLRVQPMPDDPDLAAILHGPLVLAGLIDEHEPDTPLFSSDPAAPQPRADQTPQAYFLAGSPDDLSWLQPVEGRPHCFRAVDQPFETLFVPFNQVIGRRYALYFPVIPRGSDRARRCELVNQALLLLPEAEKMTDGERFERLAAQYARIVDEPLLTGYRERLIAALAPLDPVLRLEGPDVIDRVVPGDEAAENAHRLRHEGSRTGRHLGRPWRHAASGCWWSWNLRVEPGRPAVLRCIYWGSDSPPRTFDILIDGHKLATQSLTAARPGRFFAVDYEISAERTQGRETVEVLFRPHEGAVAGGVFGCATLRKE